jgi:hypothetical protein
MVVLGLGLSIEMKGLEPMTSVEAVEAGWTLCKEVEGNEYVRFSATRDGERLTCDIVNGDNKAAVDALLVKVAKVS